jgi:hypothetical protein
MFWNAILGPLKIILHQEKGRFRNRNFLKVGSPDPEPELIKKSDPDLDPEWKVSDPQHWFVCLFLIPLFHIISALTTVRFLLKSALFPSLVISAADPDPVGSGLFWSDTDPSLNK